MKPGDLVGELADDRRSPLPTRIMIDHDKLELIDDGHLINLARFHARGIAGALDPPRQSTPRWHQERLREVATELEHRGMGSILDLPAGPPALRRRRVTGHRGKIQT